MTGVMKIASCGTMEEEFWFHVSSQEELPLAVPRQKSEVESTLEDFLVAYGRHAGELAELVAARLRSNPSLLDELRSLVSISDKRLYLDLSYIFSRFPFGDKTLCGCLPSGLIRHQTSFFKNLIANKIRGADASKAIAGYLLGKGLEDILNVYAGLSASQRVSIVRSLISPKEVQQQEAKLRGHGPEAALARLLVGLGLKLVPEDKHRNPMAEHDPNVSFEDFEIKPRVAGETFSCDMVIVDDAGRPLVCIVSLVHSSDPGQFGVDKAATVATIKSKIEAWNRSAGRKVELWGIVDGVGYSENKNGTINVMLPHFDCFIQMKSLWKAALRARQLGIAQLEGVALDPKWYSAKHIEQLRKYVPGGVELVHGHRAPATALPAGHGKVWTTTRT